MPSSDAEEARRLLSYSAESAGGIMINEFLAYQEDTSVGDAIEDLQIDKENYTDYDIPEIYVVDKDEKLVGVLKPHDLPLAPASASIDSVMTGIPVGVKEDDSLEHIRGFFKEHKLNVVPVTNAARRIVGIIVPEAVE